MERLRTYLKSGSVWKWILIAALTLAFLIALFFAIRKQENIEPVAFSITVDDHSQSFSPWRATDGNYYCFLPSYADLATMTVSQIRRDVLIDDCELTDEWLHQAEIGREYTLTIGLRTVPFRFLQSSGIAAMTIDTQSGSMNILHSEKSHEEKVCVTLYDVDGNVDYSSVSFMDQLSGRGNSTWKLKKKPYNLDLGEAASLLGMPSSAEWVLLANGYDETALRNALVYDLAAAVGLPAPQSVFVDLYLNGDYYGLYQLCEKVDGESFLSRLGLGKTCLYEAKTENRWKTGDRGFTTEGGKDYVIAYPEYCEYDTFVRFRQRLQKAESTFLGGGDADLTSVIDLDSWVKRYLLDEICLNKDGENFSSFYYWDASAPSSAVYAGPVWDYDLSLGNCNAKAAVTWDEPTRLLSSFRPWYSALTQNETFSAAVKTQYVSSFRPFVEEILEKKLDQYISAIDNSREMDGIRWETKLPRVFESTEAATDALRDFIRERISFLDACWIDQTPYHNVKLITGDSIDDIYLYSVRDGACFLALPDEESLLLDGEAIWNDEKNGQPFDFSQPITEDVTLLAEVHSTASDGVRKGITAALSNFGGFLSDNVLPIITVIFWLALAAGLVLLILADRKRSGGRKEPEDE